MDGQLKRIWEHVVDTSQRPVVGALTGDHGEWVESGALDEARRKAVARVRKITMRSKPKANWHGYHLYDYLVRVPLVVWGEAIPKTPESIDAQIRQIDLLPTLASAVGIAQPTPTTGRSVWPLVGGDALEELPAFMEASGGPVLLQSPKWTLGVRHQGWKFAYRPAMPGHEELYDLRSDPQEQHNVASVNPDKVRDYRALIETGYIPLAVQSAELDPDLHEVEQRLRDLGYL
jgi:arylsulfatase A-like enzyme